MGSCVCDRKNRYCYKKKKIYAVLGLNTSMENFSHISVGHSVVLNLCQQLIYNQDV